jgi:hypothetical protein
MGEQPGGTVYGATAGQAPAGQSYEYNATLPEWAESQCPQGRCGPDCGERCRRHEYCSEYGTCEEIPEVEGQEHRGLMLRVTTGYGFGTLSASGAGVREGSLVVGLGVDVGGTVAENLIVRGRLRGAVSYYRDNDFGSDVLFSFGTLGLGVDYYFMPINIYVGGTVSLAGITRADDDRVNRSKAGMGLDLDVGKEWWISRRWGIGIALRATYIDVAPANILAASRIDATDARLRSFHVGLQFSATFN